MADVGVIRRLSETVANRIAAGEVIERPASILKELLENALDAGARHVEVRLDGGGIRSLAVRDDGVGMDEEDLSLCVLPHATSKISSVEDLFRIASFGFRGEALPSIASVTDLSIVSRRKDAVHASELRVSYGRIQPLAPAAGPVGTTVTCRGLFAEVPARLKFLRQERTELAQCTDSLTNILLGEPELAAKLYHEDRLVLEVPAGESRAERIALLLGEPIAKRLLHCRGGTPELSFEAWIGPPDLVKHNSDYQHVFLNGRMIRDRSLAFAIKDAWRGLIMPKEHPVAVLFVEIDPAQVDVNVHPRKLEVRFRDRDAVVGLVRTGLRARLDAHAAPRALRMPQRSEDTVATAECKATPFPGAESGRVFQTPSIYAPRDESSACAPAREMPSERAAAAPAQTARKQSVGHRCGALRPSASGPALFRAQGNLQIMQAHAAWILVESEEGITILDQHALHERRLYEEILERFRRAEPESQTLLVPETIDLSAAEQASLLSAEHDLAALGLVVEPFGRTSVVIRAVPLALAGHSGADLVDEVLASLADERELSGLQPVEKLAANMACRAAVRFGDRLPESELKALVEWWRAHPLLRNCPHGRPVAAVLTLADLELQFLRKK
jgi:DNA mismatch repair protein MutL